MHDMPRFLRSWFTGTRRSVIYTIVLHHPARTTACLQRTLASLEGVTNDKHIVDVIVQGKRNPAGGYPLKGDGYKLKYADVGENLGIGGGFRLGVERFLRSDAQWLAKIDDDIVAPPYAWDFLRKIINYEYAKNKCKLGAVMMSTHRTKPRLHAEGKTPNGIQTIIPVEGYHWHGSTTMMTSKLKWRVTDFADIGCTLYQRDLFGINCMPDENLFVGGIGLDLVMQGAKLGYDWAVCFNPRCKHMNKDCHTKQYKQVRTSKETYKKSTKYFYRKWGVVPRPLAEAAGLLTKDGRIKL